jgi:hypothetical protein
MPAEGNGMPVDHGTKRRRANALQDETYFGFIQDVPGDKIPKHPQEMKST